VVAVRKYFDSPEQFHHVSRMSGYTSKKSRTIALHARWVMAALASGPPKPLKMTDLDAAFARGTKRALGPGGRTQVPARAHRIMNTLPGAYAVGGSMRFTGTRQPSGKTS
jgi:hypothetical protein